jgi:hypothetical protein
MEMVAKNRRSVSVAEEVSAAVAHLTTRLRGRLFDLRMFVRDGGVVIRGVANSYYVKQLAQHAVMQMVSLPIAANEIVVRSAHLGTVDSLAMTASSNSYGIS